MAAMVDSPPDEITASNGGHQHHHRIVTKRKRTKRPRPSSPFTAVTVTSTTSSSSVTAVTEFHGGGESVSHTTTIASAPSPIVSTETTTTYNESTVTEEEEEEVVANCLILLAHSGEYSTKSEKTKTHRKFNPVGKKSPMKVTIGGERGYECQTCNRTFNSFQALGGHRTSHKRPKPTPPIDRRHHHLHEPRLEPCNENLSSDNHQGEELKLKLKLELNQIVSAAVAATVKLPDDVGNKLPFVSRKVHECSICGAEFSSGQALGGHMRRHRPLTTVPQRTPATSIVAADENCVAEQQQGRKVLPLDLNFPAPDENEHRGDPKFQFVFSSPPPLVDCHF